MVPSVERWWVRIATLGALAGSAVLAALVSVPPNLSSAIAGSEWMARTVIGLGALGCSAGVIAIVAFGVIRGAPASRVGGSVMGIEHGSPPQLPAPLATVREVDDRLNELVERQAQFLRILASRLTTVEGRLAQLEEENMRTRRPGGGP